MFRLSVSLPNIQAPIARDHDALADKQPDIDFVVMLSLWWKHLSHRWRQAGGHDVGGWQLRPRSGPT